MNGWPHETSSVKRIFLTLTVVSTVLLMAAFVIGCEIGDLKNVSALTRKLLSYHILVSVAALIFAALVHAVLLTYFMGTSRWIEEARQAYKFDSRWSEENRRLKYRAIPVMVVCLLLLIGNIPLGALAPPSVHLVFSILTIVINVAVNVMEYDAIRRNGELIDAVVGEVRRIRQALGLPI
jgi:hypothetical protein